MRAIFGDFVQGRGAVGLLIFRLVVGFAFILHGMSKIQNPMHWMDKMPGAPPGFLQALAAISEFGGGIALILGLLTPLAALGIACTMAYALAKVHLPHGDAFVAPGKPNFETPAFYLATMVMLILTGPGALSLDAQLFGRKGR